MKITQVFTVGRPLPVVWEFFHDIPRVAACVPGADYLGVKEDGRHSGRVTTKVGPFQTSFEGEAEVTYDEAAHAVTAVGKGVDRKGASRGKMTMACTCEAAGDSTKVTVDADVQLSGPIAQFGRTSLLNEVAAVLVQSFVQNAEAQLVPAAPAVAEGSAPSAAPAPATASAPIAAPGRPVSALSLALAVLKGWFRSLFRRTQANENS
ncbi:SRPBCC family protein [Methylobacterium organophilum]|uniref:SRPBCC family protein n=1 Tax=Methylobacterium organophilum TaxID=410 RepID=UPI001F144CE9|nr:SRPBCC family protein [Methylobacterium organophilum]UMY18623.1 SRPBCC family protein [Methylobacterium organophilum]